MANVKSAPGVYTQEIDLSGPVTRQPVGIPAGVIGTAQKGPAFVPVTVGFFDDWVAKFGKVDGSQFGPLAVYEWLRRAQAVTYLRVLGVGDGKKRASDTGDVVSAGFTVGQKLPDPTTGYITENTYANSGGPLGRTYFLGCFMSESNGSTIFSSAGLQGPGSVTPGSTTALPIVRGVLMAPSGVVLRLSSSLPAANGSAQPTTSLIASEASAFGTRIGDVILSSGGTQPKQEFVLLLNGHKGTDASYPNILTASFDVTSNNYLSKVLNTDPYKMQESGHYLYAHWDIHPTLAVVTGTGLLNTSYGIGSGQYAASSYVEPSAFLLTSSVGIDAGSPTAPNFENFRDRYTHAVSPWVISQDFGGKKQDLFRLHALDDGADVSSLYKISIENIKPSLEAGAYGSFTLKLRSWSDDDLDRKDLPNETFLVDLDPTSDNYIAKKIGDVHAYYEFDREESEQKLVVEGNYPNRSNYVRVEVHPDVENMYVDSTVLPMGFRGIDHLVTSGSAPIGPLSSEDAACLSVTTANKRLVTPPVPFRKTLTVGEEGSATEQLEPNFYWGVQFEHPQALLKKNTSKLPNDSLQSFSKFFPSHTVATAKFLTGSNSGQPDTVAWGVVDADRFCNNLFTLENIQVKTGSTGLAEPRELWVNAKYVREGNIPADDTAKTRAFKVSDLSVSQNLAKFTFFMQGGFDGVNIFDEDSKEINNNSLAVEMDAAAGRGLQNGPGVRTYKKALEVMKNTSTVDVQILAIPGIREPIVTDAAVAAVEERFDALYVMDIEQRDEADENVTTESQDVSVTNTLNAFKNRGTDSSFAAAYFPDVKYRTPANYGNSVTVEAPPSVAVLGALALNDSIGYPWFAPAGFSRGALPDAFLEPRLVMQESLYGDLYSNKINPLRTFPGSPRSGTNPVGGVVVWGQKTLQTAASALDRVNVRRLLIEIRRQVRDIAQTILFEPNREATLARFSAAVTPRLASIQARSGLERFKVVIDSSTTTQDDIENNTIRGKIYVQPTKTIEFVSLDFVVANNIAQVQ